MNHTDAKTKLLTELSCTRINVDIEFLRNLQSEILMRPDLDEIAEVLSLVGNDTRIKILYLLDRADELCVCDISDVLGISVSAISHQLRKLKDRNLVISRKDAPTIYYSLSDSPILHQITDIFRGEKRFSALL